MVAVVKTPNLTAGGATQRPGYEAAAEAIADLIKAPGLRPGDRLPTERALGERLGVSRTVVREAIKVLSTMGLVRARQGSGLYVASEPRPFATVAFNLAMPVDPEHMLSLFEFRCNLEMQAARLAAERITLRELHVVEDALALHRRMVLAGEMEQFSTSYEGAGLPNPDGMFHEGIAAATHNHFFVTTVSSIHRLQSRAVALVLSRAPGSYSIAADQHEAILDAVRRGRPDDAAAAMEAHVLTVRTTYQQEMRRLLNGDPGD